ncbi:flagellar hook-associated protein FlgK [Clostridium butyricum]|uniref:flagellar hook-associated protein FlgK n=1 Tax=Clostridium butyricum TaxID=1492 RepID=UPI00374E6659
MAGLFDTFTVAKRGLSVQQGNINTTSHNLANSQTAGYSRQRAVVETTRPFGGLSKFDGVSYGQIGTGAQITTIQRIRNEFIDYQVRTENTNTGTLSSKYQYLYQVEDILNETTSTGIQGALSEFYDAFQELSKAPEKESNRTVALKKAEALATALNSRYNQLESKKEDAQKELGNYVTEINDILDQINEINKQISRVSAVGMNPNDLLDSRDYLVDQLSSKFGVKIDKDKYNTIDLSVTENVNKNLGNLVNADPNDSNYSRFSFVENAEFNAAGDLVVTYSVLGDKSNQKELVINGDKTNLENIKKSLLEDRVLVANSEGKLGAIDSTGKFIEYESGKIINSDEFGKNITIFNKEDCGISKGEISGNQEVQDTIQGYMDELDKFAASFAYAVNAIQTGSTKAGESNILDAKGNKINAALLFVNSDDTTSDKGITAKNISINSDIEKDLSLLNCGEHHVDDYSGEKDGSRALAIAKLKDLKINIGGLSMDDIESREKFFGVGETKNPSGIDFEAGSTITMINKDGTGSKLSDYYASTISKLASNVSKAKSDLSTQNILLANLENQRLSESGVSLDEEMADLIQFQHSYQANAKMINTVDELLDVVINGLKR